MQILVALEGSGVVEVPCMEPVRFAKGDAVVVPADIWDFSVRPEPKLDLFWRAFLASRSQSRR